MKRIKSFKVFESVDDDNAYQEMADRGQKARSAIRNNDFGEFKEGVESIDITAHKRDLVLLLNNAVEYGRVEFVNYLLDLCDYTQSDRWSF